MYSNGDVSFQRSFIDFFGKRVNSGRILGNQTLQETELMFCCCDFFGWTQESSFFGEYYLNLQRTFANPQKWHRDKFKFYKGEFENGTKTNNLLIRITNLENGDSPIIER